MNIKDLYNCIQQNNIPDYLLIFKNNKDDFLINQYINEISKQHNLKKQFIEDLSEIKLTSDIFDSYIEPTLKIYKTDKFDYDNFALYNVKNLIIVCNSISKETIELFNSYIIEIPKLEDWQIKDYAYSQLKGMKTSHIDWLVNICNDIDRLQLEIDRLKLFNDNLTSTIEEFSKDAIYEDLNPNTVFDLINAILTKDVSKIQILYKNIINSDISPMSILSLLYNNFKPVVQIQLNTSATAKEIEIPENRFYAIKYNNLNHYNDTQLIEVFRFLTSIDKLIKTGKLDTAYLLDYLLINIMGV